MDIFEKALNFAVKAHEGMTRKTENIPYILHPVEVAAIAGSMTTDREVLAAAVLHDVVEDTPVTAEEIKKQFGSRVAALVASETENKRPDMPPAQSWRIRKEESLRELESCGDMAVKILWLSDKLSNIRSFYKMKLALGAVPWDNFNQSDPVQQEWYYSSVAQLTKELSDCPAWQEYDRLVKQVFERGQGDA